MQMYLTHEAGVEGGGPRRLMLKKQRLGVERRRDLQTSLCMLFEDPTPYVQEPTRSSML